MRGLARCPTFSAQRRWIVINPLVTRFLHSRSLSSKSTEPEDDYYALLLSSPTPNPAKLSIEPSRVIDPKDLPPAAAATAPPPRNQILFSAPLAGPSARMRGLARGERGLDRPPEPDNCCMSGCVNCVWDAYREEVEEWAAGRQKREAQLKRRGANTRNGRGESDEEASPDEGGVGDIDEVGGLKNYSGTSLDSDDGLFEGVPVGIREFMKQEKRIRERKQLEDGR